MSALGPSGPLVYYFRPLYSTKLTHYVHNFVKILYPSFENSVDTDQLASGDTQLHSESI